MPADDERVVGIRGQEANAIASPGPVALPGPWVDSHGKPPLDAIWVREPVLDVTPMGNAGWWCLSAIPSGSWPILYSCPGALKSYLRELPEPLMTFELYDEWIQASK